MIAKLAIIDQTSIPVASKGLDAYTKRGRAISQNLANISTPGYQRLEVRFEDILKEHLDEDKISGKRTDNNHMFLGRPELQNVKPETVLADDPTLPGEINNVDIDLEMSKMAENQIQFEFGVRFIQERMSAIESAIKMQRGS